MIVRYRLGGVDDLKFGASLRDRRKEGFLHFKGEVCVYRYLDGIVSLEINLDFVRI